MKKKKEQETKESVPHNYLKIVGLSEMWRELLRRCRFRVGVSGKDTVNGISQE